MVTPAAIAPATWRELFEGGRLLTTCVLCLGVWLNAADALVVSTVMPSVAADVGGYTYFSWATAVFMLGSILGGALAGLGANRLGLRRALSLSAYLYAVGCVISALAPTIWPFLVGRALQGAGAGFIIGLCYVAVRLAYPARLWTLVFAALSSVWGLATFLGPLLGGGLAGAHLWRDVFWLFALQSLVFLFAARALPTQRREATKNEGETPISVLIVLTVAVGFTAAAAGVARPGLAATAISAGLLLLGFAAHLDRKAERPLLPVRAYNLSSRAALGYLAILTLSASTGSFSVYAVALLEARLHLDPLAAGYVASCESVGWTIVALWAARAPETLHRIFIRLGPILVATGLTGCALTFSQGSAITVALTSAIMGAGFGVCWSFLAQAILSDLPDSDATVGSAAIPTLQLLGAALGAAAAGLLANSLGLADGFQAQTATRAAGPLFAAFVPLAALAFLAAWRLSRSVLAGVD